MDKLLIRIRPNLVYLRMFGYVSTIAIHLTNITMLLKTFDYAVKKDPSALYYTAFFPRYLTCWNVVIQILYSILGLYCDSSALNSEGEKKVKYSLQFANYARTTLFSVLVFPLSCMVSTLYWTLCLYDRGLIMYSYIDNIISSTSNNIMHSWVVPIALWEMVCLPKSEPASHRSNIKLLLTYIIYYDATLVLTYFEKNAWPYPIQNRYNTLVFNTLFITISSLLVPMYYCVQWSINNLVWKIHSKSEIAA